MQDFGAVNEVYASVFTQPMPVSSPLGRIGTYKYIALGCVANVKLGAYLCLCQGAPEGNGCGD